MVIAPIVFPGYYRMAASCSVTRLFDRSQFPTADDDYAPAQRRIIDARLAKADADIKAGRVSRPFDTHEEFVAALHRQATKHRANENPS